MLNRQMIHRQHRIKRIARHIRNTARRTPRSQLKPLHFLIHLQLLPRSNPLHRRRHKLRARRPQITASRRRLHNRDLTLIIIHSVSILVLHRDLHSKELTNIHHRRNSPCNHKLARNPPRRQRRRRSSQLPARRDHSHFELSALHIHNKVREQSNSTLRIHRRPPAQHHPGAHNLHRHRFRRIRSRIQYIVPITDLHTQSKHLPSIHRLPILRRLVQQARIHSVRRCPSRSSIACARPTQARDVQFRAHNLRIHRRGLLLGRPRLDEPLELAADFLRGHLGIPQLD